MDTFVRDGCKEQLHGRLKNKNKNCGDRNKIYCCKGGSDTYDFVPSKSGDYSVSFNGKGGVLVYDDAWNEIKNIILKKQTEAVLFFRWNREKRITLLLRH